MATTLQTTPTRHAGKAGSRIGATIGAAFASVMRFLCDLSNARRCAAEVEQLNALSNAQLARRGLKRDEIVAYAFRNHMHE